MSRMYQGARRAFTMIELLVAMSIIVVLTSMVLLVVTNMNERDGTTDAAGLTRQWLMISKARAGRDNAPRGLRLIISMDPNNPAKTSPFWVTELQYIESPAMLITYPGPSGDLAPTGSQFDPMVVFNYSTNPMTGALVSKQCSIINLTQSDAQSIVQFSILQLPVLGTWHRIVAPPVITQPTPGFFTATLQLDSFPDSQMGAGTAYVTQQFGISAPPRPLFGEPPLQLPKNICIDVSLSTIPNPGPGAPGPNYVQNPSSIQPLIIAGIPQDLDILFTSNGYVMPIGAGAQADGNIFLWHRDYTKLKSAPNGNNPLVIVNNVSSFPPPQYDMIPFQNGGVQQLVSIRTKSGALGQFPVLWPNGNGFYTQTSPGVFENPYTLARLGATSP